MDERPVLKVWRERTGLSCEEANRLLGFDIGFLEKLEQKRLSRIPLPLILQLAKLYKVPRKELESLISNEQISD